jgi:transcriptional regulator with XRE-family HTH domain
MKPAERPQSLIQALTSRGFSQLEIGAKIGLHQTQVSKLATGVSKDMLAEPYIKLYQFAQKCGVIK